MIENIYQFLTTTYTPDPRCATLAEGNEAEGIPSFFQELEGELAGKTRVDEQEAWSSILSAMDYYICDYPGTTVDKQKVWNIFRQWLHNIAFDMRINVGWEEVDELLPPVLQKDHVIGLIKDLHYASLGPTKDELARKYHVSDRTIKDTINKLNRRKDGELRIAGQKVDFQMVEKYEYDEREHVTRRHFSAKNTVNPVFLQLNIAQVHSLLNGLKLSYFVEGRNLSVSSAVEIWSQLSDYTKDRIRLVYCEEDAEFSEFIQIVEDEIASTTLHTYKSERDQIREEDLSPYEEEELYRKLRM